MIRNCRGRRLRRLAFTRRTLPHRYNTQPSSIEMEGEVVPLDSNTSNLHQVTVKGSSTLTLKYDSNLVSQPSLPLPQKKFTLDFEQYIGEKCTIDFVVAAIANHVHPPRITQLNISAQRVEKNNLPSGSVTATFSAPNLGGRPIQMSISLLGNVQTQAMNIGRVPQLLDGMHAIPLVVNYTFSCSPPFSQVPKTSENIDQDAAKLKSALMGSLSEDLLTALEESNMTDIEIVCADGKIPAHKSILVARSEYFRSMFSHDTKENRTNTVSIKDFDAKTMNNLIRFFYSDNVPKPSDITPNVLAAADVFGVLKLKDACESHLVKNIGMDNVIDSLICGHYHGAKRLKRAATDFVFKNMDTIKTKPEWKDLRKKHPEIVLDMFEAVATSC